mmetsp:Transcript_17232/g.24258  ORF Transcript_17232/g.24258 Transcript_17232/m.24258 type:complete len:619 (+) Transcript_17232:50-1906(+)
MVAPSSNSRKKKKLANIRRKRNPTDWSKTFALTSNPAFRGLLVLLFVGLAIQITVVYYHDDIVVGNADSANNNDVNNDTVERRRNNIRRGGTLEEQLNKVEANPHVPKKDGNRKVAVKNDQQQKEEENAAAAAKVPAPQLDFSNIDQSKPYLYPPLKPLPPHATIDDASKLRQDTLDGSNPTIAGIASIMQEFLKELHTTFHDLGQRRANRDEVIDAYLELAKQHLLPLDNQYRGQPVFPIRQEEESIYISIAAYRDHLLGETLKDAFRKSKHPDKLYVGAIVQNCFGIESTCRTGVQVVGKDAQGRPQTKVSDAPPDINGIEQFCTDPDYVQYCNSGQIRTLYVNETESLGPAAARYYASKLWGGETYYVQVDAHLQFADEWDQKYIDEFKATKSYPHSILSSYPPGFSEHVQRNMGKTKGSRLCTCEFSTNAIEMDIIRINTGVGYKSMDGPVTQIPFMAAGFFFTHAEWLVDVPFDPLLPWTFMGEEIALSMRSWTSGWDMYAPRVNLIAHQYRPGRLGLPKFWETVGRVFGRPGPGFNTQLQRITLQRLKHMLGYEESSLEHMKKDGADKVLVEIEHYGMGTKRTRDEYLKFTNIDMEHKKCSNIPWCNQGTLE